jgi:hypothetical protein
MLRAGRHVWTADASGMAEEEPGRYHHRGGDAAAGRRIEADTKPMAARQATDDKQS